MDMSGSVRWWWVRHAPVTGQDGKLYGAADVDCDVSDALSFKGLASLLPADAVWLTSHLSRTRKTAAAIFDAGLDAPLPRPVPELAEQNFGRWQGLSWQEMERKQPDVYKKFWQSPADNAPPGGESFAGQIHRVGRVIEQTTAENNALDIVAVAHGGTIRAAIAHALQLPAIDAMSFRIDTLSVTRLDYVKGGLLKGQGGSWRIHCVNQSAKPVVSS